MSLAGQALTPIDSFPVELTCHAAVWYWAAREAEDQGMINTKPVMARAEAICTMPNGPQNAMFALHRAGIWEFTGPNYDMPPLGTVLLWDTDPSHSAVVTGLGTTSYNQACIFTPFIMEPRYSSGAAAQLQADRRRCCTILELTIVRAAAAFFK